YTEASKAKLKNVLVPLSFFFLCFTFVFRERLFHDVFKGTFQCLALCPFFALAILAPELGPFKLLNTKPLKFLGVLSYTLYLIHKVIIIAL
ncbi:hypothetical protein ABTN72_19355, partial [Acinetobacter baumannii]